MTTPHQTVPTPRVDYEERRLDAWDDGKRFVSADFARQLESKLSEALEKLDRANTPFEDADTRIEVFSQETWYAYRVPNGGEVAPFQTWREAYRAAESHLHQIDLHSATTSRDEALAAGGEMRAILSPLVYSEKCAFKPSEIGSCINSDFTRDRWCGSCIRLERIRKALSTTCGQGWKSPEEVRTACEIAGRNGALIQSEEVARLRAEVERLKGEARTEGEWRAVVSDRDTALQQARELEERCKELEKLLVAEGKK